jgi:hypothetical protein
MNHSRTVAIAGILVLLVLVGAYVATRPADDPLDQEPRSDPAAENPYSETPEPMPPAEDPKPEEAPADEPPPEEEPEKPVPIEDEKAAIARVTADLESAVFSLSVSNVTIRDAFEKLSKETGIAIDVNRLSNETLEKPIAFSFDETPLADALEFICGVKGLSYEIGPRGIAIK